MNTAATVWVLTSTYNAWDDPGEDLVDIFAQKPTHVQLTARGVPTDRLRHVLNGGGRKGMPGWRPDCSEAEQEHTPPKLADWLIEVARRCKLQNTTNDRPSGSVHE